MTFEKFYDCLEVTTFDLPNPDWTYTDKAGHVHQWTGDEILTMCQVDDGTVVYGEEFTVWHWECRECGEHIMPGRNPSKGVGFMPGLMHYRVNGREVSKAEYERLGGD